MLRLPPMDTLRTRLDLVDGVALLSREKEEKSWMSLLHTVHSMGPYKTAPIGSTFLREYEFFCSQGDARPNPMAHFFRDLLSKIAPLSMTPGTSIILMLDTNATLDQDTIFKKFISAYNPHDLHHVSPAPSTDIGSSHRRIDFIFGNSTVKETLLRSGTLSYIKDPSRITVVCLLILTRDCSDFITHSRI
jgi:hypothetical protein